MPESGENWQDKGKKAGKKVGVSRVSPCIWVIPLTSSQAEIDEAEGAIAPYWEKTKDVVLRPGTLGGLMGVGEWQG